MTNSNLTIGFDAKRLFLNQSGLGNYSRTLVSNLAIHFPNYRYLLYSPQVRFNLAQMYGDNASFKLSSNTQVKTPNGIWKLYSLASVWRSLLLGNTINKDKPDIYHGLSNELPLNIGKVKARKVVSIHDLIFLRYPQWYPAFDRWIYLRKWKHSCQKADKIVAISQQTKDDLVNLLGVQEEKIRVVYQSCNADFYNDYNDRLFLNHGLFAPVQYNLPPQVPKDFILYVGAITERKNLLTLVKAMEVLQPAMQVPLVVVGKGKIYKYKVWQYLQEHRLEKQVVFIDHLPTEELKILFRCAKAVVYPSLFEGFGLPVLEGLFSRTPVISSKGSCFAEAGGPGTYYVDPLDVEELAHAIEKVLTDGALQMDMIMQGWDYAQQFKAENTAAQLMEVYSELV